MRSRLTKSVLVGSKIEFPLVSMYSFPPLQVPISGRLSMVKRATKLPPGTPSPLGKLGISCGSLALLSPSK